LLGYYLPTPTVVAGVRFLPPFVCMSVCLFPHDILQTDAARITKRDIQMLHDESWKPIYFGIEMSRSRVTKNIAAWVFALL